MVHNKQHISNSTGGFLKHISPNKHHDDQLHVYWTNIDILVDEKKKAKNSENPQGNPQNKIPLAIDNLIKKAMEVVKSITGDKKKAELLNETIYDGITVCKDILEGKNDAKTIKDADKFLEDTMKLLSQDDKAVDFLQQVKDIKNKFLS